MVYVAFVDYEKAWDSLETLATLEARHQQDIHPRYIKVKKDSCIYTSSIATDTLHTEGQKIPIRKGDLYSVLKTHLDRY